MVGINKFKLSEDYSYLFPYHRFGWKRAIEEISKAIDSSGYIYLEPFFERVFGYERQDSHRVEIYEKNPWVAFVHEPALTGNADSALSVLLLREETKKCLPNLKGIYCLTEAQKKVFSQYEQLKDIPISVLKYPTEYNVPKWDVNKLTYDVYEIGTHYRMSITRGVRLKQARNIIVLNQKEKKLTDEEYDETLSNSIIVEKYFFNTAASTTIVECMAACNPLVVNKIDPIVEYLGEDYPNYYINSNHLYKMFLNKDKLRERLINANLYLKDLAEKRPLSYSKFIKDISNSEVYNSI